EARHPGGSPIEIVDGDSLKIGAEHRLDGELPAGLDDELLREAIALRQAVLLEPGGNVRRALTERRLLQGDERGQPSLVVRQRDARLVELARDSRLLLAHVADLLPHGVQRPRGVLAGTEQTLLLTGERRDALLELGEAQACAFRGELLPLLVQAI